MKCSRKSWNDRIKVRLAKHAALMAQYISQGISREAASKRAYEEITQYTPEERYQRYCSEDCAEEDQT